MKAPTNRFLSKEIVEANKYPPPRRQISSHVVELTKREVALTLLAKRKRMSGPDFARWESSFLYEQGLTHLDVRHLVEKFSREYH